MSEGFFRCEIKVHARVDSGNAVKSAAYQMKEVLKDERTGQAHRKFSSSELQHTQLFFPEPKMVPPGFEKPGKIWSEAEKAETRKNSRVAREALISLPYRFSLDARKKAVTLFCRWLNKEFGVVAMASLHAEKFKHAAEVAGDRSKRWFASEKGGSILTDRNAHAHVLFSTRRFSDRFGEKTREFDDKVTGPKVIKKIRKAWARVLNLVAQAFGHKERFTHLSLKERGINREPTKPLGLVGAWMESIGIESENGTYNRTARKINALRAEIEQEQRQAERQAQKESAARVNKKAREILVGSSPVEPVASVEMPEKAHQIPATVEETSIEKKTKGVRVRKNKPSYGPDLSL